MGLAQPGRHHRQDIADARARPGALKLELLLRAVAHRAEPAGAEQAAVTQLGELQGRVNEMREQGIEVATISYDSPEVLADFAQEQGITYKMLSDVGSETITDYGILNTVAEEALGPNANDPDVVADFELLVASGPSPSELFVGIAYPGTFMLDRDGVVESRFFEDSYQERNTTANLMLK